jgi:cytosine/adenosine deaminase-related metal-dependent hydrolase
MQTIAKFQSYVPVETILKWATLNGAEALGFDSDLGSMELGKTPGINLLYNFEGKDLLGSETKVKKLI